MTDTKAIAEHRARVAGQWIGWAGKPEIGCGEGRVRDAASASPL